MCLVFVVINELQMNGLRQFGILMLLWIFVTKYVYVRA